MFTLACTFMCTCMYLLLLVSASFSTRLYLRHFSVYVDIPFVFVADAHVYVYVYVHVIYFVLLAFDPCKIRITFTNTCR